jgi:hypothetical protein
MSRLDDILQEYFVHTPEPDGTAWGKDTILDYEGGKQQLEVELLKAKTEAAVSIRSFLAMPDTIEKNAYAIKVCDTYIEANEAELREKVKEV